MILYIKPIDKSSYDCFQGVAASAAAYWGKEHFMMFAGSWFFDFKEDAGDLTFGDRISVGWRVVDFEALEKYHGIRFNSNNAATIKEVIDLIKCNTSAGIPVILHISSYYCPWLQSYMKYDIEHYCMAVGYDDKGHNVFCIEPSHMKYDIEDYCMGYEDDGHNVFCIEPYIAKGVVNLPFLEMEKGTVRCLTCEIVEENYIDGEWRNILKNTVMDMGLPGGFAARSKRIREFAYGIGEGIDSRLEKQGFKHYFAVPLFSNLKNIGNGRINFAYFLSCLSEKYNNSELYEFSKEMLGASELWYRQRLNFIKAAVVPDGNRTMRNLSKKIIEIADYEEILADKIMGKMYRCGL